MAFGMDNTITVGPRTVYGVLDFPKPALRSIIDGLAQSVPTTDA
jgi:hypothetical protein